MNRLTDDQGKLYEDLLNDQQDLNTHIPLHIARLQQLENQLKQQQNQEKKEQKIHEILLFIQEKLLPLFDEDSILKFFGQKNALSTEKEIQTIKTYFLISSLFFHHFSFDLVKWKNVEIG